jgi:hypothetical protein
MPSLAPEAPSLASEARQIVGPEQSSKRTESRETEGTHGRAEVAQMEKGRRYGGDFGAQSA